MTLWVFDFDDTLTRGGDPTTAMVCPELRAPLNAMLKQNPKSVLICTGRNDIYKLLPRTATGDVQDALATAPAVFSHGGKYRNHKGEIVIFPLSSETEQYRDGLARDLLQAFIKEMQADPRFAPYVSISWNSMQKENKGLLFAFRDHVINVNYAKLTADKLLSPQNLQALVTAITQTMQDIAYSIPRVERGNLWTPVFRCNVNHAKGFVELLPTEVTKETGLNQALYSLGVCSPVIKHDIVFVGDDLQGADRGPAALVALWGGRIWQTAYETDANVITDVYDLACPNYVFHYPGELAAAITAHRYVPDVASNRAGYNGFTRDVP